MRVTMNDIARQAGVSSATVCNAINGKQGVNATNRARILAIARDMGYSLNRKAGADTYIRLVIYKRSGQIVVDTEFFTDMLNAVADECQANQIGLMVTTIQREKDPDVLQTIREISRETCTGVLVLSTEMAASDIELFMTGETNLVALDSDFPMLPVHTVSIDNEQAGRLAALHLLEKGHRRVGYLDSSVPIHNGYGRRNGFLDGMAEAGFPVAAENIWYVTPTVEGAYQEIALRMCEGQHPRCSAFFAFNDIVAVGSSRAFREHGMKIPEDISLIGMDDLQICRIGRTALTTVRVPRRDMARTAVRRLLEMNRDLSFTSIIRTRIGVELVERDSVRLLDEKRRA